MLTTILLILLVLVLVGAIGGPRFYRGRTLGRPAGRRTVVREYESDV